MADKKQSVKIRASKEEIFDVLKAAAPGLFGNYTITDVIFFSEDPEDNSKILIEFNEES